MPKPLGEPARRWLQQALALPDEERLRLAEELAASLPDEPEDPAVLEELERRFARYERGETHARPWGEVMDEIEARRRALPRPGGP